MPCRSHTFPLPCHNNAVLKATSQGHGTARHESGLGTTWYVWISIGRPERACGRPARVRLLPATTRSSTNGVTRRRLALRIFPSTTRNFTKYTVLSKNCRVAAWNVWLNAAGELHGYVWISFRVLIRDNLPQHCNCADFCKCKAVCCSYQGLSQISSTMDNSKLITYLIYTLFFK
jgi:hypothetical protein